MAYELKGGEEIRDGVLYGWTGEDCSKCNGHGVDDESHSCGGCAGTGEKWGRMPDDKQPVGLLCATMGGHDWKKCSGNAGKHKCRRCGLKGWKNHCSTLPEVAPL